jgi:nucleoside-diphosphate-sugar epimerase
VNLVLVTGVAGFVGSRVAEMLLERGDDVVGIDSVNDYYSRALKKYRLLSLQRWPNFRFHRLDVDGFDAVDGLFGRYRFDTVFHLAGRAGVRASLEDPWAYMRTNAEGTLNVLEAMRRAAAPKLVLASTSSLYAGHEPPFREDVPVDTPLSPYAASKKAAETMAWTYHRQYGLDVTVLRYFTVFGPAGRPDMAPFRFVDGILRGRTLEIHGTGMQTRDFTYIDDIARGTVLAERRLGYEILNLGGGNEPVALLEFLSWIEESTGRKARLSFHPSHPADMDATRAGIGKAERLLGWRPVVAPREGVRRTVDWHMAMFDGSRLGDSSRSAAAPILLLAR